MRIVLLALVIAVLGIGAFGFLYVMKAGLTAIYTDYGTTQMWLGVGCVAIVFLTLAFLADKTRDPRP